MIRLIISAFISICLVSTGLYRAESQEIDYQMILAGGSTVADYKLISFRVKPENDQDPWTNQDILIDDLGPYDPYYWRLFRWDPTRNGGLGDYVELNQRDIWGSAQNIDYGRGYWIISVQTKTVDIMGVPDGSSKTMILYKGWNQIGNPFYDKQAILRVGPVDGPYVPLEDDLNNIYTDSFLWEWVGGEYQITTDPLEVGKGFWLRNITDGVVELEFVPYEAFGSEVKSTSYDLSYIDVTEMEEPPSPPSAIGSSSSSVSGESGSGGCFIATAAYRYYDHPRVQLLRKFRDQYLLANNFGRMFVNLYYRYSPNLAQFVAKRSSMKALVRLSLMPLIGMSTIVSKMNVYAYFAIMASPLLGGFFFLRRRQRVLGRWKEKHSSKSKGGKRKR